MSIFEIIALALAAALTENLLLGRVLGAGALARQKGSLSQCAIAGITVTVIMAVAAPVCWCADFFLLRPLGLEYLRLVVFIALCAVLELVLSALASRIPRLGEKVNAHIKVSAVNAAVLGVILLAAQENLRLEECWVQAVFSGAGYALAAVLLMSVRGRLAFSKWPRAFEGVPIALVTVGLLAMAFLGFTGLQI